MHAITAVFSPAKEAYKYYKGKRASKKAAANNMP